MVHAGGISSTTSHTTGIGLSRGGIGVGAATTHGVSQTVLSARMAPPAKHRWIRTLIGGFFVSMILSVFFGGGTAGTLVVLGGWALTGYLAWKGWMHNREEHPTLLDQWTRSFLCDRCGCVFLPSQAMMPPRPGIPS